MISRVLLGRWGLALIGLATLAAAPEPAASDAFLARQAAALRPAFRADLEALADAPRYTIEASIDPELGSVAGAMRLDYTNTTGETLTDLAFRLFPNAESIYGGGSLSVTSVARAGTPLESESSGDGTVLWVPLERPLAPGASLWLDLTFSAQVPARTSQGYGIFNRALGVLTLAGWYPLLAVYGEDGWDTPPVPATGDAMFAETSFYEVMLTTPAGYQVVSTGTAVGQEEGPAGVTWHLVSGPVREFAIGISDRFDLTLSRSNRYQEWSLTFDYVWLRPGDDAAFPLTAAAHLVTGLVTEKREGISTFSSENMKLTFQLSLALELPDRVALLLVPSYASKTNHGESESEGTLALGTGVRWTLFDELSLLVEWIPVLAGYHAKVQGWGVAVEKKIGGHVFQVFALSSVGIPEPQYLHGGDLCIREGDIRFGFNIFRWF